MNVMIKDLPKEDKPREKALSYGITNLTDSELISILIRTGTKELSALELSHNIINEIGDLHNFDSLTLERLGSIKGMGIAKSLTILAAIEVGKRCLKNNKEKIRISNSKDIYENYRYYFINQKQELFMILFLNNANIVTSSKIIYKGNTNLINVSPQDIFKEALLHCSSKIILIHNHPSGSIYPSKNDVLTTENLVNAANILNISILDHLIISNDNYYSFYDNGDLK